MKLPQFVTIPSRYGFGVRIRSQYIGKIEISSGISFRSFFPPLQKLFLFFRWRDRLRWQIRVGKKGTSILENRK